MVGIAFGVDREKQQVGDVLVSKSVIPYEIKRVETQKLISRNPIPPSGSTLLNRFSNGHNWRHTLPKAQRARVFPAHILSGESLIDNEAYRKKLLSRFPLAEGGEMEGAGVFCAAHDKGVQWILVKAICDFADGRKNRNKASNQRIAAEASASLCSHVFSQLGNLDKFASMVSDPRSLKSPLSGLSIEQ